MCFKFAVVFSCCVNALTVLFFVAWYLFLSSMCFFGVTDVLGKSSNRCSSQPFKICAPCTFNGRTIIQHQFCQRYHLNKNVQNCLPRNMIIDKFTKAPSKNHKTCCFLLIMYVLYMNIHIYIYIYYCFFVCLLGWLVGGLLVFD